MEIQRIYLENFMNHKVTDIDCTNFNSVLIVGSYRNNEKISNGVGKSTIFKAVDYALFGEYGTKTVDKIVRDGTTKAKVIVEFKISRGTFRVTRTRNKKGNKGELLLEQKISNDIWENINQKTSSENETELAKLIQITYAAFKNSVLFSQFDLVSGLTAAISSEARKSLLKEILNLVIYSKLEDISKQHTSNLNKQIISQKAVIKSLGQPKNEIEACKLLLDEKKNDLNIKLIEKDKISSSLDDKKNNYSKLINNQDNSLSSLQEELIKLQSNKASTKLKIDQKKTLLNSKENSYKDFLNKKNKELLNVSDKQNQLAEIEKILSSLDSIDVIQNQIEDLSKTEKSGEKILQKQELIIEQLSVPLPESSLCNHCRQSVSIEHLKECQEKIDKDLASAKNIYNDAINKLKILKKRKEDKNLLLKNINQNTVKTNSLKNEIVNLQESVNRYNSSISDLESIIQDLNNDLNGETESYQEILNKEESLKENIAKSTEENKDQKIQFLKQEINILSKELKNIEQLVSNLNLEIGILTEKIKNKQLDLEKIDTLEIDLKNLEKEYKIRQIVTRGFGTSGIPSLVIMNTIIDDLQLETNNLLSQIRPGLEIKFDNSQEDKLDITYQLNGVDKDYEQFSGGQKFTIILALKIGLLMAIQNRLGIDIKFLELDEVDATLDKASTDAFVEIIRKLQNRFKIFVITHNDELKSKFSNIISVEYNENDGATGRLLTT